MHASGTCIRNKKAVRLGFWFDTTGESIQHLIHIWLVYHHRVRHQGGAHDVAALVIQPVAKYTDIRGALSVEKRSTRVGQHMW